MHGHRVPVHGTAGGRSVLGHGQAELLRKTGRRSVSGDHLQQPGQQKEHIHPGERSAEAGPPPRSEGDRLLDKVITDLSLE